MKAITSEETKKRLLEQPRGAVYMQLALWSACFVIEAMVDDKCDAFERVYEVARKYAGKEIRDSQVERILFGTKAEQLARATAGRKNVCVLATLTKESRLRLLCAIQNAVQLRNAFLNEAESIAEVRECELGVVLDFLSELTVEVDLGLELPEGCLTWFFGVIRAGRETDTVQPSIEIGKSSGSREADEAKTQVPQEVKGSKCAN